MKKKTLYIDRLFRGYAEREFGKANISALSDPQIEEARCNAFVMANDYLKEHGQLEKGAIAEFFFLYLKWNFLDGLSGQTV